MPPIDTPQTTVRARLDARARRIAMLRRRVAATSLATFALAFGAIWQTGSMGAATAATPSSTAVTNVASTTPASATTTATTAAATDTTTADTASTSNQATAPSAVTTSQS